MTKPSRSPRKDRIRAVADEILSAFKAGEVPKALAQVFLHPTPEDSPIRKWSWRNRLLVALRGERDARGFRQWKAVGRTVKKGARAFYILGPCTRRVEEEDEDTGETHEKQILVGFTPIPVFGYSQTEGDPLPGDEKEVHFLDGLPLVEVARAWDLDVRIVPSSVFTGLGSYTPERITLSVENLSTWAHELVHAADDRLGHLQNSPKQEREVVAELGGAVLLEGLGYEVESDRGGAWEYVQHQADNPKAAIELCTRLLERICGAVELILNTSKSMQGHSSAVLFMNKVTQ